MNRKIFKLYLKTLKLQAEYLRLQSGQHQYNPVAAVVKELGITAEVLLHKSGAQE